jgi:hypothetical protein
MQFGGGEGVDRRLMSLKFRDSHATAYAQSTSAQAILCCNNYIFLSLHATRCDVFIRTQFKSLVFHFPPLVLLVGFV